MSAALTKPIESDIIERVLVAGDLGRLTPQERVAYYMATCRSVGLNPMTKPFEYIQLNGKLTLYAVKNATDQLRQIHGVSIDRIDRVRDGDLVVATAHAKDKTGREDEDVGAVDVKGLAGEKLANAMMKVVTKAKRRVTLSICGLSFLDESELETVPGARKVKVDDTGQILGESQPEEDLVPALEASIALIENRAGVETHYEKIRRIRARPAAKEKLMQDLAAKAKLYPKPVDT